MSGMNSYLLVDRDLYTAKRPSMLEGIIHLISFAREVVMHGGVIKAVLIIKYRMRWC